MQNVKTLWYQLTDKIRFLIIGAFNAAVSYCFYAVFCLILGAAHYQVALILAWILSSGISFTAQKYLVFKTKGNWLKEYSKCCLTWFLSYVLNALFLEICISFLHINVYIAQIISTFSVALFTYILFKRFAFKSPS